MDTNQPQEKVFFQNQKVTVTNARYVVHSKTYAIRNISSVVAKEVTKSRALPILFFFVGILSFAIMNEIAIVVIVCSIIWLLLIRNEYSVYISTNAGEIESCTSENETFIQTVAYALEQAIIYKG